VTRIPEIEKNIALGVELLSESRDTRNIKFGRLARAQFDIDQAPASKAMRVAGLYAA
jgi:hypothetical protein